MATKQGVLQAHLQEWLACKGNKRKRGALIKHLSQSLKMHKKSIGRSMKRLQLKDKSIPEKRGRPKEYGADVNAALCELWEEMEYPCAENMTRKIMDEYLFFMKTADKWNFNNEITNKLLFMSEGTKKLRIADFRKKRNLTKRRSATIASPLKGIIPIRKSHTWNNLPPGYLQTDSVVHCGDLLTGDVAYSVGCVDFVTYWSVYTAQWNKGQEATKDSLIDIRNVFPFPWIEIHPDSGNEFINYHVRNWAIKENINMTRSEPYKKNDNMCIEERNSNIVRRHIGYARIDDILFLPLVKEILKLACLLHNHFRPTRRMLSKERINSKWKRTFEKEAKTPYQRVIEHKKISRMDKEKLEVLHETLNPLLIKKELDMLKEKLDRMLKNN